MKYIYVDISKEIGSRNGRKRVDPRQSSGVQERKEHGGQ